MPTAAHDLKRFVAGPSAAPFGARSNFNTNNITDSIVEPSQGPSLRGLGGAPPVGGGGAAAGRVLEKFSRGSHLQVPLQSSHLPATAFAAPRAPFGAAAPSHAPSAAGEGGHRSASSGSAMGAGGASLRGKAMAGFVLQRKASGGNTGFSHIAVLDSSGSGKIVDQRKR
jgi:hypothetical protein